MAQYLLTVSLVLTSALAASPWYPKHFSRHSNGRVIGGSDAPDGKYPYQTSVQVFGFHNCGGSIINHEWILTAAHCIDQFPVYAYSIYVGSNDLTRGGTVYKALEIYIHEKYDPNKIKNDVGLVKVEPITYTKNVQKIALESEEVGGSEPCVLSGWGSTEHPELNYPDKLQHIKLETVTVEYCRERHAPFPVVEGEICTLTKAGEGVCYADSGSPLVRTVNGMVKQIGVTSWVMPCAIGYPDVFSRVSSHLTWIREKCNCV